MTKLKYGLCSGLSLAAFMLLAPGQAQSQSSGATLPPVTIHAPDAPRRRARAAGQSARPAAARRSARQPSASPRRTVARSAPLPGPSEQAPASGGEPAGPAFLPGSSGRPTASPLSAGPTTTTTTRAELDRLQIQSFQELGQRVEAGIAFNRNNNSVNIRGLEGPRVLTSIDGIRQTFNVVEGRLARSAANAFDYDFVSTLDLVRGSSLVGPGSLGGALVVRTLNPKDLIRGNNNFGVLAKTGYDSLDRAWFASGAAAARTGNTYYMLQGTVRDGHEVDNRGRVASVGTTRTKANPAEFMQYGFLGKVHHYVDDVHRFGITGEYFRREDRVRNLDSTVSLTGNYRPGSYRSGDDTERKRVSLTYDYAQPGGWVDEASAHLYWQNSKRNALTNAYRYTSVIGPYSRDNEFEENAFGFNGHMQRSFITGPLSHRVLVGTELRTTMSKSYTSGYDNCGVITPRPVACNNLHTNQAETPDISGKLVGIYIQDEIGLLDNRLRVTPGVRFDWYEERPQNTPAYSNGASRPVGLPSSSSDSAWSPRVRVEYDILRQTPWFDTITAFAQWSQGFRAPTVSELYFRFGGPGTYLRTGNPDLKPETSDGVDIGVRFGNSRFGGSLTYFHTNYTNFIESVQLSPPGGMYPQGGILGYRNVSRAEIQGIEANGHYAFAPNWRVRGSFSYVRGINKDQNTFLNSIPAMQGIVGLAYDTGVWGTEISTKIAARRDDVAARTGTTQGFVAPAYTVWNLTGWWQPPQLPNVQFTAGVYNIFDRKYFEAATIPVGVLSQPRDYFSEPGRTAKITMKYQF